VIDNMTTNAYSVIVSIWATVYTERWKLQQSIISLEWGTTHFKSEEVERTEFIGETVESPIDGEPMLWPDTAQQFARKIFSALTISALLGAVGGVLCGIYVLKYW
jgi:hypothetical protein